MRRRRSSRLGKKLPARSFGIASSRSPACVVTVFSRCPLRQVVRVSVRSPHSAPIFVVASASISSCSSLSATSRTSSRPSAERSDSSRRSRSCWDKATVHPLGSNCPFTPDSCTVACQLSREQSPAGGAPGGAEPAHSTAEIPYTTQRDAIDVRRGPNCTTIQCRSSRAAHRVADGAGSCRRSVRAPATPGPRSSHADHTPPPSSLCAGLSGR